MWGSICWEVQLGYPRMNLRFSSASGERLDLGGQSLASSGIGLAESVDGGQQQSEA